MTNKLPTANCQPKVVAAIPCYKTEPFIADVVSRARKHVDEVIVIDDGSPDGTAKAAEAAGAVVVNHIMNKGYGQAIKSCIKAAKDSDADILVTIDGDGQHNPDEIPQLLEQILNGEADLVIGSRFLVQSTADSRQPTDNIHEPSAMSHQPSDSTDSTDSTDPTINYQLRTINQPCQSIAASASALSPGCGTSARK